MAREDPRTLLQATIADPFTPMGQQYPAAPDRWSKFLVLGFPFWTFQSRAFLALQAGESQSTDPLGVIAQSIRDDEGYKRYSGKGSRLERNLFSRRSQLGRGTQDCPDAWLGEDAQVRVHGAFDFIEDLPDVSEGEDDSPHSPVEDLGRELMGTVDVLRAATTKEERVSAQVALNAFLTDVGARRRRGRQLQGPPDEILLPMFAEGKKLLNICWGVTSSPVVSDSTREVLSAQGIKETDAQKWWALRLALPFLSWPELQAFSEQFEIAENWKMKLPRPTARRFTMWVLAHRLDMKIETLAKRVGAHSEWEHFKYSDNPIVSL